MNSTDSCRACGTAQRYAYKPTGALDALTLDLAGTVNDATWTFGVNRVQQMTSRTVTGPSYVWMGLSKPTRSYVVNGLNEYTAVNGQTVANDNNGNLTGWNGWSYGYDPENRMVSATGSGTTASYAYDALGRRISKTVNGVTTNFLYEGSTMIAEYDGTGNRLRFYGYGAGADDLVGWWADTGSGFSRRSLGRDHQGSIIAESDSGGTLLNAYSYSPYGEPDRLTGIPFRYTGQYLDAESGLYYYKARMYSPSLGRFMQTDPIGYKDDLDWYSYVGNDPVDKSDPTGTEGGPEPSYQQQRSQIEAQIKFNNENPKIAAGLAIGAATIATGGLALEVGVPGLGTVAAVTATVNAAQNGQPVAASRVSEAAKFGNAVKAAEQTFKDGGIKALQKSSSKFSQRIAEHVKKKKKQKKLEALRVL